MLEFKKAEIKDLSTIQKIAYDTWPNTFGKVIPKKQINYMLQLFYNKELLKKQMLEKGHNFLLAENDNQAIGFTSYEIFCNAEPQLMIHKLYILPLKQGLGIGTELLNLLSDIAMQNNNKRLRLKVFYKNVNAISFYKKYGFKNIGTETTNIGNDYSILDNIMVEELK
ncbi:MAG: GNAT family N-acetyltransferase [Ignavibacterium sp.]|nr:GNAT family N-acetyltransferase [Ignavibacterium sp.]